MPASLGSNESGDQCVWGAVHLGSSKSGEQWVWQSEGGWTWVILSQEELEFICTRS